MLAGLALVTSLAFGADDDDEEKSIREERVRLYRSAYFLGRGDTGIATADDQEAIFYNPAGLAQGKGIYKRFVVGSPHVEFSKATRDVARQLELEDQDQTETLKKQIGKLTGWIGYTLSTSERKFAEINGGNPYPAPYDRTHDIALVGIYQLNDRWTFSANWVYQTGTAVTMPYGKYVINGTVIEAYTARNAYRMPAYQVPAL